MVIVSVAMMAVRHDAMTPAVASRVTAVSGVSGGTVARVVAAGPVGAGPVGAVTSEAAAFGDLGRGTETVAQAVPVSADGVQDRIDVTPDQGRGANVPSATSTTANAAVAPDSLRRSLVFRIRRSPMMSRARNSTAASTSSSAP